MHLFLYYKVQRSYTTAWRGNSQGSSRSLLRVYDYFMTCTLPADWLSALYRIICSYPVSCRLCLLCDGSCRRLSAEIFEKFVTGLFAPQFRRRRRRRRRADLAEKRAPVTTWAVAWHGGRYTRRPRL